MNAFRCDASPVTSARLSGRLRARAVGHPYAAVLLVLADDYRRDAYLLRNR